MTVSVRISTSDGPTVLVARGEPAILRPGTGTALLEITGASALRCRLDGHPLALSGDGHGTVALDLTRSTGFHRPNVEGSAYWFASEDSKLRLDGIVEMLQDLRTEGTGWSGQMIFSDGALLRDPHVVYGWLDDRADELLRNVRAINRAPIRAHAVFDRVSRRGGPGVRVAATTALLRRRPREYLEEADHGILTIGGQDYNPLRVVVRSRSSTLSTTWNRRYVALLAALRRLVQEVVLSGPGPEAAVRCANWQASLTAAASHPTALDVARNGLPPGSLGGPPGPAELTDRRYRSTYGGARDLALRLGWHAQREPIDRYAYVGYSDQIYQAWVASTLARVLSLSPTSVALGGAQPAFADSEYDLYYDTVVPGEVLRSWRSHSSAADSLRPDLLLHHRQSGRVLVLDAKYRNSGNRATESSRKEVLSYMAAYGLAAAGIAYPPAGHPIDPYLVSGSGNTLFELPLRPGQERDDDRLRQQLRGLLHWGRY